MKRYLLSVDNGGTYIKAGLYDLQGNRIGLARHYNHLISDRPGHTEYDPEELWGTNCRCMREVIAQTGVDPREIAAIGISGQGSGCYFMGENGEIVRNFISSADRRAQPQVERWRGEGVEKRLYPYIYRNAAPGHTNAILAWLRENEPENYKRIRWLFAMKDYLAYRFTGNIFSSRGCMSSSGLMNLQTASYDPMLAEISGIPEMKDRFGPLRWDLEICGTVRESAAAECGCAPGTPVAAGSHDVIASALAMGVADSAPCFVIMGTCAINAYVSPVPILDGSVRHNELFAFPGLFLIEEPGSASSGVLEWAIDALFDRGERDPAEIYARINSMVESVAPGAGGPLFIPYLRGHDDLPSARGAWIGLAPEHARAQMLSSVYESVVFSHMSQLEKLFMNRDRPAAVRLGGGAANSAVWMQMFADALGIPIEIVPGEEIGAKGAAIAAAVAAGVYPDCISAIREMTRPCEVIRPRPEFAEIYARKFARFKAVMGKLPEIWAEFS